MGSFNPCPVRMQTTVPFILFNFNNPVKETAPDGSTYKPSLLAINFKVFIISLSFTFSAVPFESLKAFNAFWPSNGSPHSMAVAIVLGLSTGSTFFFPS